MKKTRPYNLGARAVAAEDTARRLIAAMQRHFAERPYDEVTLEAVAAEAGVTLQTLLRRFGSKAGLFAAAAADGAARIAAQRGEAPAGDPPGAIANLFDHYEAWGDVALRLVAEADRFPEVGAVAREGRATHAAWVERVFADSLERLAACDRDRRRAQLIAVCDVTMWKLLRRDLGLSRHDAQAAVLELVLALCADGAS